MLYNEYIIIIIAIIRKSFLIKYICIIYLKLYITRDIHICLNISRPSYITNVIVMFYLGERSLISTPYGSLKI